MCVTERDIMGLSKKGIIVDTEAFHIFANTQHKDSKPVHQCIKKQKLQLAYGDDEKSLKEIKRYPKMYKILGRVAVRINSKEKKKEIDENRGYINGIKLKSNDTHIIAIALVEQKARLLFSVSRGDSDLHDDFTNPAIIKNPRGKVYQKYSKHQGLLP